MIEIFKQLFPFIIPYRSLLIGSVLLSFVLAAIKGAQAYMVKHIFDQALGVSADLNSALFIAGALLLLGIINFPARFYHFYWINYVVQKATCDIRQNLYGKVLKLPSQFYTQSKQGVLLSNLTRDTEVFSGGARNLVDLIREPLTAAIMLGLCLYRDWQLSLVIFMVTPLFIIVFNISGKKVRFNQKQVQEDFALFTHDISEGLMGHTVIKAFNLQKYVNHRFKKAQEYLFGSLMRTTIIQELAHPLVEFIGAIAFSGVILFAHYRMSSGELTTGEFISFITALALLMDPIRKYSQANVKLNQAKAAGSRIFRLLHRPSELDEGQKNPTKFNQDIKVKNLTFKYEDHDVLKNINLTIPKGKKIALIGASGSGKSTLISLLLGIYPIEKGSIEIDGIKSSDISLHSLRSLFGFVGQDIFLFNDSIKDNLTLGESYSDEVLAEALKISHSKEFLDELPNGIETLIGDRGLRLSGGQRQRLTIARAFLKNPDILLFDEATSALDNKSEKIVQKALDEIAQEKTVIAVAHRLTTIQNFDNIYVFKHGEIIENGNHRELMNLKGEYYNLYQLSIEK